MSELQILVEELPTTNDRVLGRMTLNLEKTLHSLTREMVDILLDRLTAWAEDDRVVCVFIDAVGDRAFCAGGDVQALHASSTGTPGGPCEYAESFFEQEYRMNYALQTYPKPVVCWGHGIVMGGGLGVMAACSHKVATAKTRIAMPEITIALFPDVGGSWFLNRMPGESGLFLSLTAAHINAADALYTGLADVYVDHEHRAAVVATLEAAPWTSSDNGAIVTAVLQEFAAQTGVPLPEGNIEPRMDEISRLCDRSDLAATVAAILALGEDDEWLSRARGGLAGGSPLAAAWIFRQLVESANYSLEQVFQSELRLATNIMRDPEFGEGVRALLIDKDRNPQWQYASLGDIPEGRLDDFFAEPWPENPLADLAS